jgi:asparagine synthase (glutamine-hydrolysing)
MKTRQNMGKLVLRSVLEKKVPRQLFNRPKAGFAIPVGRWLNGSLRDWAESQLSVSSLNNAGIFDVKKIRKIWLDHTKERENNESMIWALLMYLSWLNR